MRLPQLYVRSYLHFVGIVCVILSQLSEAPVTLIYTGASRTGILATEADIPTLFGLSHNVNVRLCILCVSPLVCML